MTRKAELFIGWRSDLPQLRRRAVLGAGLATAAGMAAGVATVLSTGREPLGPGVWDSGELRSLSGVLVARPYPLLRTLDLGGTPRTVFLAAQGKSAALLPPPLQDRWARVSGTLIHRGRHAMLAVEGIEAAGGAEPDGLRNVPVSEQGEVLLTGEIVDAKCWFGAMRPGYGKTHKACAALCARGGLPLAFCRSGDCGPGAEAPLFLDADGLPHRQLILPLVADPVLVQGRLVQVGDVTQFRAAAAAIRRL